MSSSGACARGPSPLAPTTARACFEYAVSGARSLPLVLSSGARLIDWPVSLVEPASVVCGGLAADAEGLPLPPLLGLILELSSSISDPNYNVAGCAPEPI